MFPLITNDDANNNWSPPQQSLLASAHAAELTTERDNDAAAELGARPNQEREPAARHKYISCMGATSG